MKQFSMRDIFYCEHRLFQTFFQAPRPCRGVQATKASGVCLNDIFSVVKI